MKTTSNFKATTMTRVLLALALLASIGSTVMAQTFRPLTGTSVRLNSAYPSGGTLILEATPSANYTLTLPPSAPAARAILAIGATAGTFDWTAPLDVYDFTNGLTESGSNTIKLGGTLSENTTLALSTHKLTMSSATGGDVEVDVDQLTLKGTVGVNAAGSGSTSIGNSTGTLQLTSPGLNVSTAGVISDAGGDIEFAGNILPSSGGNYSLGSDAVRWRDAFIGPSALHIGPANGFPGGELLIGYSGGTANFDIDGTTDAMTLHATNGLDVNLSFNANSDVTLGDATTDLLKFDGSIVPMTGTTDGSVFRFEGTATGDGNYTTVKIQEPTAARTLLFPDADGMLAVTDLSGGVVVVGTLQVYQRTDLKDTVNLGDGIGDVIWVNTAADANLRIEESEIRRLGNLTVFGADNVLTSKVSSLQLGESAFLNSTDGDMEFTADNGTVSTFALTAITLEAGNTQTEGSMLYLDPNTPYLEMNKDQYFRGKLDIDGATFRTVSILADGYSDGSASIQLQPTDGVSVSANTFLFSNGLGDEIFRATSDGSFGIGTAAPTANLDVAGTFNVEGAATINSTGTAATTIGNTNALTSLLGGVKVSAVVATGAYTIGNELVVVQTAAGDIELPTAADGRIVIIRNNGTGGTIDILENGPGAVVVDNLADDTSVTLIAQGGAWYQIGN